MLALLLAFQALVTVRLQAMGRMHRHVTEAVPHGMPALIDVRRMTTPAVQPPDLHAGTAGLTQRHHHAASDTTVRITPDDRVADDAAAEDGSTGQPVALLLGSEPPSIGRSPGSGPPSRSGWAAYTRSLGRLDRPPSSVTA